MPHPKEIDRAFEEMTIPRWVDILKDDDPVPEGFESADQIQEKLAHDGKTLTRDWVKRRLRDAVNDGKVESVSLRRGRTNVLYYKIKGPV